MKKRIFFVFVLLMLAILSSCSLSKDLTERERIIKLFSDNKDLIISSIESGDFTEIEKISGIQSVYNSEENNYIDFFCGGKGFGSGTSYFGFFYSPNNDKTAWSGGMCSSNELIPWNHGYKWQEKNGDNEYYVEELCKCFFYYEVHF